MPSRAEELRKKHRRILACSLGVAALLHIGFFVFAPSGSGSGWELQPTFDTTATAQAGDPGQLAVVFGPPKITLEDGTVRQEPPDRTLEVRDVDVAHILLERDCEGVRAKGLDSAEGAVELRVNERGRAIEAEVAESPGDECKERVFTAIAGSLLYHWLPDEEAPAPVDLIQPMRLESMEE